MLIFRNPGDQESQATAPSAQLRTVVSVTDAQRRGADGAVPAVQGVGGVRDPADERRTSRSELYLSVDAVKKHMRALFEKFGVQHLPQNEKRARLVERAFAGGFISEREL